MQANFLTGSFTRELRGPVKGCGPLAAPRVCVNNSLLEVSKEPLLAAKGWTCAYSVIGQAYAAKGMYSEALQAFEKYHTLSQDSAMSHALSGYAHGMTGERTQALKLLSELSAASR